MITVTIFTLFVLYTLACIADGPDVKPLWKRRLGWKLERWANGLKPIDYCQMVSCKYYQEYLSRPRPSQQIPMECSTSKVRLIEKAYKIGEDQLYQARRNEDMARERGLFIPPHMTGEGMMNEYKQMITDDLTKELKPFVSIKVIHDEYDYCIRIIGSILVGKPKETDVF